ncbi:CDGSH iron-sulfur domain-containing protein [Microbulbifer sp. 2205BS26-8]|uniref:CDGSH iron-sulfur domain-containing protein n=1 Tax=Microbulbifer sp. 2205BS26-8 TaxID=3064386 RepID=UPI00273DFA1F|nr:CDGSH iron-sulfur domain-containing protein [Microbulbifer sp. 2205BS26-8]MDP5208296.1 CDGSH iron-sulfur domain-containing protein [Microbulbifer sp. 2205BS26-8]
MIATFWTSTVVSELIGHQAAITAVKNGIVWGMLVLIPSMVIAGGSGMSLGQRRGDQGVVAKKKRMPIIALNGLIVLLPSAVFLASKANAGSFDSVFYAVQTLELIAGATNLTLMGLNIRDGLRLTGRIASPSARAAQCAASIVLRKNGPAIISGVEDFIGADGAALATQATMTLCRCGASKNKPYCDGSHTRVGYLDGKSPERTIDELSRYRGREINILYNRLLCSKAYECGRRLEAVFDTTHDPWIDPDKGSVAEILDVIRACPSGALGYEQNGEGLRHEVPSGTAIETEASGPYRVRNVALANAVWCEGACENKYALCRCGASKNKPFCDGSHVAEGFIDAGGSAQ